MFFSLFYPRIVLPHKHSSLLYLRSSHFFLPSLSFATCRYSCGVMRERKLVIRERQCYSCVSHSRLLFYFCRQSLEQGAKERHYRYQRVSHVFYLSVLLAVFLLTRVFKVCWEDSLKNFFLPLRDLRSEALFAVCWVLASFFEQISFAEFVVSYFVGFAKKASSSRYLIYSGLFTPDSCRIKSLATFLTSTTEGLTLWSQSTLKMSEYT